MKVKAMLQKADEKKHSVRYNGMTEGDREIVTSVYIMKTAFTNQQYPPRLTITIEEE